MRCGSNACVFDGPGLSHCQSSSQIAVIAGAGAGGAVVIIVIAILIALVIIRRRRSHVRPADSTVSTSRLIAGNNDGRMQHSRESFSGHIAKQNVFVPASEETYSDAITSPISESTDEDVDVQPRVDDKLFFYASVETSFDGSNKRGPDAVLSNSTYAATPMVLGDHSTTNETADYDEPAHREEEKDDYLHVVGDSKVFRPQMIFSVQSDDVV